jgi:hypothetical protein
MDERALRGAVSARPGRAQPRPAPASLGRPVGLRARRLRGRSRGRIRRSVEGVDVPGAAVLRGWFTRA